MRFVLISKNAKSTNDSTPRNFLLIFSDQTFCKHLEICSIVGDFFACLFVRDLVSKTKVEPEGDACL